MKNIIKMKKSFILIAVISVLIATSYKDSHATEFPDTIKIEGIALNPEGIEYDKNDHINPAI